MSTDQAAADIESILRTAFEDYTRKRAAWYEDPRLLRKLLSRDVLPFALRGVATAEEFLRESFAAHEAASEETMIGNAWQASSSRTNKFCATSQESVPMSAPTVYN